MPSIFALFTVKSWAGITYTLSYDPIGDKFTVSFVSTVSYPAGTAIGSSYSTVVFSSSYNTAAITTTGVTGGTWAVSDKVTGSVAGTLNGLKIVGFATTGATVPGGIVAGTSYPAYTFTFGAGLNCVGTLRLFVDATDNADPSNQGLDFTSYLEIPPPTDYNSANSDITMQTCATLALPVKFSYFSAQKKNADGILSWIIQNQDANATHYDVERSYNGVDFTAVASVPAVSNGGPSITYNYTDANVFKTLVSGLVFYRIKEVDADGSFTYTDIKNLRVSSAIAVNLYPNPTTTSHAYLTVDMQNSQTIYVSITDAAGKQVNKLQIDGVSGYNMTRLNVTPLPKGTYMVNVKTGTYSQTLTLVKQ